MNGQLFFSSKWKIELCSALLGLLIFSSGCSLFKSNDARQGQNLSKPGFITQNRIRAREQKNTFLCLVAEQGKPFSFYEEENGAWLGAEPEMVRMIAKNMKMNVVFVPVSQAALAAALRNGRGDLAIGKLTTKQIAVWHQTAAFPYADAKNGKFAFMVRNDDLEWKSMLEKAAAGINGNALLKSNAEDLKPISVELDERENSEKVISISVDLQTPPAGKEPVKK